MTVKIHIDIISLITVKVAYIAQYKHSTGTIARFQRPLAEFTTLVND